MPPLPAPTTTAALTRVVLGCSRANPEGTYGFPVSAALCTVKTFSESSQPRDQKTSNVLPKKCGGLLALLYMLKQKSTFSIRPTTEKKQNLCNIFIITCIIG